MNINLCLIQMRSIHLDIYPSLHTRPVSSRSCHCVDTLFRTNSELPPPTKDQLKTYTFPNRLATHMRSSSFNLYTIRQCSRPFKTVGKIIDVASQSTLQTANTVGLHELSMWQAFVARQSTNQTVIKVGHYIKLNVASIHCEAIHPPNCIMYLASRPLLSAFAGELTIGFGGHVTVAVRIEVDKIH